MKGFLRRKLVLPLLMAVMLVAVITVPFARDAQAATMARYSNLSSASISVFATGLNNPRGLTFGPDGNLYVAEGGLGGKLSTVGKCPQVPGLPNGPGPYTGGFTASISKISPTGVRTRVVDHLPSSQYVPGAGSIPSGVADVKFIHGILYAMEAGAGCSHGLVGTDNTIFRVNANGTTTTVADLSVFLKTHPVAIPDQFDFEPDGTPYSMVVVHDVLYATQPNQQEVDRITLKGQITRLVDLSTLFVSPNNWQGDTSIVYHDGNFYFGTLGLFPVVPKTQNIYELSPTGFVKVAATGLTAVLGIAFDARGRLCALETTTTAGLYPDPSTAGTGKVVRVNGDGRLTTIASGLYYPTAMTFDPDGDELYVSNHGFGFGPSPGAGQILRIDTNVKG